MKLTISLDILEEAFLLCITDETSIDSTIDLCDFLAEKGQVAYTTENEAKFTRKIERTFKTAFHEIVQANQKYQEILDQDKLLSLQEHSTLQGQLINSVIDTIQKYPELQLIRVELTGSWPVYQTEAGHLDLSE